MDKKVKVIVSFDAEFSINGAFSDPIKNKPCADDVFRPNSTDTVGLTDILNILTKNDVVATFFTEALNSYYFGVDKMKHYVKEMVEHRQDIQLHTHPCWATFKDEEWQKNVMNKAIKDNFNSLSKPEVLEMLSDSLAIFEQWGVPRPKAFRAGNLATNREIYSILSELDFLVTSNIGLPIFTPQEAELNIQNTVASFDSITEYPVTTYTSMGIRKKALTITGCSFLEMKSVLEACKKNKISHVVILSHVHEFIKVNPKTGCTRQNKTNLKRLDKLCDFVNNNEKFEFSNFGKIADEVTRNEPMVANSKSIATPMFPGIWSVFQNQVNDRFLYY